MRKFVRKKLKGAVKRVKIFANGTHMSNIYTKAQTKGQITYEERLQKDQNHTG